jgi:hypothetical protein
MYTDSDCTYNQERANPSYYHDTIHPYIRFIIVEYDIMFDERRIDLDPSIVLMLYRL